jgi:hypothetical protein
MRFFQWKDCGNISDRSLDDLRQLIKEEFTKDIRDVRGLRRNLAVELGLYVQTFNCCIRNCMAFTGEHRLCRTCLHCKALRFRGGGYSSDPDFIDDDFQFASLKAEATYSYISIIPHLKLLYANPKWAKHMRCPTELLAKEWEQSDESEEPVQGIRDVWEGQQMQDLRRRGTCSPAVPGALCPVPKSVDSGLTDRILSR